MKDLYVIAAACRNGGIGYKGNLPWRLKNEMAYFTKQTVTTENDNKKNAVVMGRKTWESIPTKYRPLPNRFNVILSTTLGKVPDGADYLFPSLKAAMENLSQEDKVEKVWVIGGSGVYEETIKSVLCKRIYLTRIDQDFECDTFFPNFDQSLFHEMTNEVDVPQEIQEEKGITYKYHVYERKMKQFQ